MFETFSFQLKEFLNDSINSSKLKQTKKGFEPLHTFLINSSKIPPIQVFKQTEKILIDARILSILQITQLMQRNKNRMRSIYT